jgi:hypothetical protein
VQVASEDTVLPAAREYAGVLRQNQAAVYQALGPHIRCQHLSMFWLSACVHAKHDGLSALLGPFNKQLQTLLMMRHADSECVPTEDELQEDIEGAPTSWILDKRAFREVHSVQVVWPLSIDVLRRTAHRSSFCKELAELKCPGVSAPLGGLTWSMLLQADWDPVRQATQLGLFCTPRNAPHNCWYRFRGRVDVEGDLGLSQSISCSRLTAGSEGRGWVDFFGVGWMSGGWDEEAWVARGLPAAA